MAYANFKPLVWSKKIQHDLPKFTVFESDCDYRFSGEAKKGKTVKILGVSRPTIGDYTGQDIGKPEIIPDTAVTLPIDQAKFFNFMVDDVDAAQSVDGLMSALLEESTRAMAEQRDIYIASLVKEAGQCVSVDSITTPENAKDAIDEALTLLWKNGVSQKDDVTVYLNPVTYMLFQDYVTQLKTNNDATLANGLLGCYAGAKIKMSNNFYKDGNKEYMFVKTSKAIAFCGGIDEVEAYRPEGLFCDAVKGLNTFGGKIIRPKELVVIKASNVKAN